MDPKSNPIKADLILIPNEYKKEYFYVIGCLDMYYIHSIVKDISPESMTKEYLTELDKLDEWFSIRKQIAVWHSMTRNWILHVLNYSKFIKEHNKSNESNNCI